MSFCPPLSGTYALPPSHKRGHHRMTTMLAPDDDQCSSCAARAGSCSVRRWLSGRPCCAGCSHPTDATTGAAP